MSNEVRTFRELFDLLKEKKIPLDSNIIVCPSRVVGNIQRHILKAAGIDDKTAEKIIDKFDHERGMKRYCEIPDEMDVFIHSSGYPVLEINGSLQTGLEDFTEFAN